VRDNTGWEVRLCSEPSARTVVVISTQLDAVIGEPVAVGNTPGLIAIAPDGKRAYVTNLFDNTVSIIQITGA
jgi:DNA-binding beta-propeller fold protein YncE